MWVSRTQALWTLNFEKYTSRKTIRTYRRTRAKYTSGSLFSQQTQITFWKLIERGDYSARALLFKHTEAAASP